MQRMMATENSTKSKRPLGALLPISIEKFTLLRTTGRYYVDKTFFVDTLLRDSYQVMLFKIHRRSAKSLFADTVANFVDISKRGILTTGQVDPKTEKGIHPPPGTDNPMMSEEGIFKDLYIDTCKETKKNFYHQYPVVQIGFAGIPSEIPLDQALRTYFIDEYERRLERGYQHYLIEKNLRCLRAGEVPPRCDKGPHADRIRQVWRQERLRLRR